jgi:hypothetical protein
LSEHGEVHVRFEETEVRTSIDYPEAFPLYPYEEIEGKIMQFTQLKDMEALLL